MNGSVFSSNGFLWEAFNVKLCTLCLYSVFIWSREDYQELELRGFCEEPRAWSICDESPYMDDLGGVYANA